MQVPTAPRRAPGKASECLKKPQKWAE